MGNDSNTIIIQKEIYGTSVSTAATFVLFDIGTIAFPAPKNYLLTTAHLGFYKVETANTATGRFDNSLNFQCLDSGLNTMYTPETTDTPAFERAIDTTPYRIYLNTRYPERILNIPNVGGIYIEQFMWRTIGSEVINRMRFLLTLQIKPMKI